MSKERLGKGISALIQSKNVDINNITSPGHALRRSSIEVIDIEIDKINVNPLQPRKEFDEQRLAELKDSITLYGLLNPITVKEIIGGYEIVAGERRYRACKALGWRTVPAIITSVNSNAEQLEKALIENIQREDLNPIEIANSYQQLIEEFQYKQEQLADRIGKERSSVTNMLRLLKLPLPVQDLVLQRRLSLGHAKVLLALEDSAQVVNIANDIVSKGLSVRATEVAVRAVLSERVVISKDGKTKAAVPRQVAITTEDQMVVEDIQNRLRAFYGTNIKIFTKPDSRGTVELEFYSAEDFNRIIELLER